MPVSQSKEYHHVSVLRDELVSALHAKTNDIILDCTLGGGGHSLSLADSLAGQVRLLGIDLDRDAIEYVQKKFTDHRYSIETFQTNFRHLDLVLKEAEIKCVNGIMMDLGVSSHHFDTSGRGFSFTKDEPLSMTLGVEQIEDIPFTAHDMVNEWAAESLADIIYQYGEERQSRRIAAAIVEARADGEIITSKQLAEIIEGAVKRRGKTHPATKTFQAIRMAVNEELQSIQSALDKVPDHLCEGGRIGVISFHSLEDRIVKHTFKSWKVAGLGDIVTKKPITPTAKEITKNPRSRSSKLRVFVRNNNPVVHESESKQ